MLLSSAPKDSHLSEKSLLPDCIQKSAVLPKQMKIVLYCAADAMDFGCE